MATCSSILIWKIPWTEELGWLQSMGLQRVRHNWAHIQNKGKVISCSFLSLTRLNIDLIFMYAKICKITHQFSSVQFSRSVVHSHVCVLICSVVSDLWPFVHGIFQARILEQVAISYSRGSAQSRYRTRVSCISCIGRWTLHCRVIWEPSCGLAMYNTSNGCSDAFSGIGRGGLSRHLSLPHSLNVFPGIRDSFSGALEANCEERLEC